jgi:hypothetical protein
MLTEAMSEHGESWADVESCTLTEEQLDMVFDPGYGDYEGRPFTLWTVKRVYFPSGYDGAEDPASVARHPDGQPTDHVGGGSEWREPK